MKVTRLVASLAAALNVTPPIECPACEELTCTLHNETGEYLCYTCGTVLDSDQKVIGNIFSEDYTPYEERSGARGSVDRASDF